MRPHVRVMAIFYQQDIYIYILCIYIYYVYIYIYIYIYGDMKQKNMLWEPFDPGYLVLLLLRIFRRYIRLQMPLTLRGVEGDDLQSLWRSTGSFEVVLPPGDVFSNEVEDVSL